jgi:hypothetical protein
MVEHHDVRVERPAQDEAGRPIEGGAHHVVPLEAEIRDDELERGVIVVHDHHAERGVVGIRK